MPRGARLDAPGTLHHVMIRGIGRRTIVDDDKDREDFFPDWANCQKRQQPPYTPGRC